MILDIQVNLQTLMHLADMSSDYFLVLEEEQIIYLNKNTETLLKYDDINTPPRLQEILIKQGKDLFLKGPDITIPVQKRERSYLENGKKIQIIALSDLREIYEITEFLEARCNEFENFSYRAAHDLKNPIAAARQYLEVTDKENLDIEMLQDALKRTQEIIDGLYQLSGLSSHRTFKKVDLNDLISSLEDMNQNFPLLMINCRHCFFGSPEVTLALMQNLFKNTVDHYEGDSSPQVLVSSETENDKVIITYEDNGKGIPEDKRKELLEEFHKGPNSRGLGLGMTIISKAVELQNGNMTIGSSSNLGGVKVTLTFPGLSPNQ